MATLPEWNNYNTSGESYEQALKNAREVLQSLVESSKSQGQLLPEPQTFQVTSVTG